jgi:hypothetical protein
VLSSFVYKPEAELAELLFHELAHQVVYAKDDPVFNESFAEVVAEEGLKRYLVGRWHKVWSVLPYAKSVNNSLPSWFRLSTTITQSVSL